MERSRHGSPRSLLPVALLSLFLTPSTGLRAQQTDYFVRKEVSGRRGGNLVVAASADPSSFNRMFAASFANIMVVDRMCADLVHINRATLELEPALATSWNRGPDGKSWTLHLRKGVRFSDSSPFTADDVVFTLDVLKNIRPRPSLASQLESGGQFPACVRLDSHTVRISFAGTTGLGLRGLDSIPMLPRSRLRKVFEEGSMAAAWAPDTAPSEISGLGPFRLREYRRGERIVLERNPYYWKRDQSGQVLPYFDSITFMIVPDRNTEALRLETGELDLVNVLSAENYAQLRRNAGGRITVQDVGPGLTVDFLWFNLNPSRARDAKQNLDPEKSTLFQKPDFRRGVAHAINREGIARSLYFGLATPQYGPISSGNRLWFNTSIPRSVFDLGRARELFAQAGLRDRNGDGFLESASGGQLEISVLVPRGNAARENMAQVIKNDLAKAGLRIVVNPVPVNELITRIQETTEYEAILFGFTPTDVAPDLQAEIWYSSGTNHFWHPAQAAPATAWEARMDALTTILLRSLDSAERLRTFFEIQNIWARELPAIPTVASSVLVGWQNQLGNLRPSILPPQLLWNAEELTRK